MARSKKPAPIPNIDMGGRFCIIDTTGETPRWKVLERGFATRANAKRVARKHGLKSIWILDDLGGKELVNVD